MEFSLRKSKKGQSMYIRLLVMYCVALAVLIWVGYFEKAFELSPFVIVLMLAVIIQSVVNIIYFSRKIVIGINGIQEYAGSKVVRNYTRAQCRYAYVVNGKRTGEKVICISASEMPEKDLFRAKDVIWFAYSESTLQEIVGILPGMEIKKTV